MYCSSKFIISVDIQQDFTGSVSIIYYGKYKDMEMKTTHLIRTCLLTSLDA